ncbi:MAG: MBL fold metallo-hydrolase [bacterium]
MRIEFLGGARTVTGAAYRVQGATSSVLVDCGLFQGARDLEERNRRIHVYRPAQTDAVVLTHAHMDHAGLLPAFVKAGYSGPIYCTAATKDLCHILLLDSAHIQEMEAEWKTRKNLRKGMRPQEPLYTQEHARRALELLRPMDYQERREVAPGIYVRFQDAGHILGSAAVEMWLNDPNQTVKVVFSGDLGRKHQPIIRNPQVIEEAQVLLVESTYGDRTHKSQEETVEEFRTILETAFRDREKMIIPAFAVGRTQEVLYILHELNRKGQLPSMPVFVDSPLATAATEIFRKHPECFDGEARAMIRNNEEPLDLPNLVFTRTVEESRSINELNGPAIVISASGMANAGRILHHLKHNLWRPKVHVLFIGFQAQGTLGRLLVEGARKVRIFGESVAVRAQIHTLGGFSAHADRDEILDWVSHFRTPGIRIFVIHGEEKSSLALAASLREKGFSRVEVPSYLESADLAAWAPQEIAELPQAGVSITERLTLVERRLRKLRKKFSRTETSRQVESAVDKKAQMLEELLDQIEVIAGLGARSSDPTA